MPFQVFDRLYGKIEFSDDELRLFQTKELTRLRHVSLSAVPPWALPAGVCASKFEHTVGVGFLAKLLSNTSSFQQYSKLLFFAALAHDLGTPPFSHVSEVLQRKVLNLSHEEFAKVVLKDSEFAKEAELQGVKLQEIIELVEGKNPPLSDLINGSIDLDNLDNSLRFGLSMGLLKEEKIYSPERIAESFVLEKGQLFLAATAEEDLQGWERTRQVVYNFVNSRANLAPGTMLLRALELAYQEDELTPDFFRLTDDEAARYLRERCNSRTQVLMENIWHWRMYPSVFSARLSSIKPTLESYLSDPENTGKLTETLSSFFSIPAEDVCVCLMKNKGFKQIHIPILGSESTQQHVPMAPLTWIVEIFIHPKHLDKAEEISELVSETINGLNAYGKNP